MTYHPPGRRPIPLLTFPGALAAVIRNLEERGYKVAPDGTVTDQNGKPAGRITP